MIVAFWNWLDRYLFGEFSEGTTPGALGLRLLRYPYALLRDLSRGQINLYAMGLVYATLLSLVPLIAFAFAVLKAFGAHTELQPIILEFFKPMGLAADEEFPPKAPYFAHNVSTGARLMAIGSDMEGGPKATTGAAGRPPRWTEGRTRCPCPCPSAPSDGG